MYRNIPAQYKNGVDREIGHLVTLRDEVKAWPISETERSAAAYAKR